MAVPFLPYVINVADGRVVPLFEGDFILMSPLGYCVHIFQLDGKYDWINRHLITRLGFDAPVNLTSSMVTTNP